MLDAEGVGRGVGSRRLVSLLGLLSSKLVLNVAVEELDNVARAQRAAGVARAQRTAANLAVPHRPGPAKRTVQTKR